MNPAIMVIGGTILFIGLLIYFVLARTKKQAWEGELLDKRIHTTTGANDIDTESYVLYVKTLEGKTKKSYVNKKQFELFAVGDKLIKQKGKLYPEKA